MSDSKNIFSNLEVAFASKSDKDLKFSKFIFGLMGNPALVKLSTSLALLSVKLRLPISWIVKATIFKQFCGGETQQESLKLIEILGHSNVKSILDYSIEGEEDEAHFDSTAEEIKRVIELGKDNPNIPVACIKLTGIGRFDIYEKVSSGTVLSNDEQDAYNRSKSRLDNLCAAARENKVPLYIDAEESWIQPAIDDLATEMILKYNTERAYVFNTLQMYRWDRLSYFEKSIQTARDNNVKLGVKIVRGAYIEKENERAREKGYKSPIQPSKDATDNDYNKALELAINNIDCVEICAGTHNEYSSQYLTELIQSSGLPKDHAHIYFSQLFGMSDQISFNLSALGYSVSKYVPYGPVKSTLPYLIRRAEENTSMKGQVGKELKLILEEQKRRKSLSL